MLSSKTKKGLIVSNECFLPQYEYIESSNLWLADAEAHCGDVAPSMG